MARRNAWTDPRRPVDNVTFVAAKDGRDALIALVKRVHDAWPPDQYRAYAEAVINETEKIEASYEGQSHDPARKPGKYTRQCARAGCTNVFTTNQPNARYCGDNCRQAQFQASKRARALAVGRDQPRSAANEAIPV